MEGKETFTIYNYRTTIVAIHQGFRIDQRWIYTPLYLKYLEEIRTGDRSRQSCRTYTCNSCESEMSNLPSHPNIDLNASSKALLTGIKVEEFPN